MNVSILTIKVRNQILVIPNLAKIIFQIFTSLFVSITKRFDYKDLNPI